VARSAPADDATDDDGDQRAWGRWLSVAEILGPTSALTALGLYFGYVTLLAQFRYFGLDIDTLQLPTREIVLRSVAALWFPLLVALAAAWFLGWVHGAVMRSAPRAPDRWRHVGAAACTVGLLLSVRGTVGILGPSVAANEPIATTPLALGIGVGLIGYGAHIRRVAVDSSAEGSVRAWLVAGLVLLCAFWATNSFAAAYGTGQAQRIARNLGSRPELVLDVREPLQLGDVESQPPGEPLVTVRTLCSLDPSTSLPPCDGAGGGSVQFRYRYRGLRLLVQSGSRMFLVPGRWFDGATVLVVDLDDEVRVQFLR
jgi:hypothetical protein